jgi:hypothetical protein
MTSPLTISAAAERVELDASGRAETTFTVTNNGPTDQRIVLDVVPGETADRSWFTVVEPQVLVPHGGSVTFVAKVAVPAGTPAGTRWLAGRAYSADTAPEETSVVSDRVAFEVKPSKAPVPWWRKWWWLIAIGALLVVVLIVVVLVVVLGDDDPPPPPGVRATSQTAFGPNTGLELDDIVAVSRTAGDIGYVPELQGDGFAVQPFNGATMAKIGPTDRAAEDCAQAATVRNPIPVDDWQVGEVLCVRTDEGRSSVVELTEKQTLRIQPPPPPTLQLRVTTFELPEGG